ncbi:MAG: hypothetical protein ABWZ99_06465 [Ilumatobacteraceae bacterium]
MTGAPGDPPLDPAVEPAVVPEGVHAGDVIIAANAIGTFAFAVTAITAAIVFSTASQWVGAITAMSLFAVGVFAFLWSFWNVVQRSREEQIAVTQVYLLLGAPTPNRVRRRMLACLVVQVAVAFATALGRSKDLDGSPGTSLAVGVLVPMFGIGLNGLWAAYHGTFPALMDHKPPTDTTTDDTSVAETGVGTTSLAAIDKNEEHG